MHRVGICVVSILSASPVDCCGVGGNTSKNQTRKSFSTLKMEYIYHDNKRCVYLFMSFSLKKLHWETNKENSKSESGKYKEEMFERFSPC